MEDFPTPKAERLQLVGAFVDVQRRLTHGEQEDMFARIYQGGIQNRREVRTAKIVAYLLAWSLTKDGKPVPYSLDMPEQVRIDTVRSLDPDRALEIYEAIELHEVRMAAARAAEKKILSGPPPAGETSASPSDAAGASSGSAPST